MTARDLAEPPEARSGGSSGSPSSRSANARRRSQSSALSGRYRSLFVIGRGGMGSVEAALAVESPVGSEPALDADAGKDRRPYERIVALKRLLPDGVRDKRRAEMFLREARLAALLDHPNIVGAYDYGEIDGELYLAMEYVEGQPLSRVLQALADAGERMPTPVVAWMLAEVCRGLHAAHELADPATGTPLQLVHRDVSPQNVMLGYDGRVRLLDFGVAKIVTESVTKTGEVKGKTAYMSPEQAMGEPLDRRSDLFGVGAVLFECLALRRMWGSGTDMEVIRKLALESPPSLDETGADVPAALAELHARLVARDAKGRPATAIEVAEELVRFAGDPDSAARELRAILEAHFATQAKEQRARLTGALDEVAPAQADELRDSLLPASATTPIRMRGAIHGAPRDDRDVGGSRAQPAPASDRSDERPRETPRPANGTKVALALVGFAAVALVAWRLASGDAKPAQDVTVGATSSASTSNATPTATGTDERAAASRGAAPLASSTSAAGGQHLANPPPATSPPSPTGAGGLAPRAAAVASSRDVASARVRPPGPPPRPSASTSTSTSTTGRTPPPTARPTDLDEKPF